MSKHTKKVKTDSKNKLKKKLLIKYFPNTFPRCYWCKKELLEEEITLDHLIELSNEGSRYKINNLVISCEECNNNRSNNRAAFNLKMKKVYGNKWSLAYARLLRKAALTKL